MSHTILIVESQQTLAEALHLLLTAVPDGYQVESCSTAEVALERLENRHFDLVITDLELPVMNGLELLKKIRQMNLSKSSILLTAIDSYLIDLQAHDSADGFAHKPFTATEILAIVRNVLKRNLVLPDDSSD